MFQRHAGPPVRTLAAIAVGIFAAFALLLVTDAWQLLERRGFDTLTVAQAPGKSSLPITIVGIDEPSFANIGRQWPWPRSLYAKVIDNLSKSGALVIGLDVLLSEPSTEAEDRALAEAIKRAGNVIIASDMQY